MQAVQPDSNATPTMLTKQHPSTSSSVVSSISSKSLRPNLYRSDDFGTNQLG